MKIDFNDRPLVAIWEVTQACDLVCSHCRACAQPLRHPLELSTREAQHLIDQVGAMQVPIFVLTGGDPLKRPDILELVEYASRRGVRASLSPSATPLLTPTAIAELKKRGLMRLALSLDGSQPEIHDAIRGVPGSFARTLEAVAWARQVGLPVQINTTIGRRNIGDIDAMAGLMEQIGIVLWSVFFLIPTGRGRVEELPSGAEFEEVFEKLYNTARRVKFHIKTTEAPHYRRLVLQKKAAAHQSQGADGGPEEADILEKSNDLISKARIGVSDGKGFVFISHLGEVCPSGFLPLSAGNVREQPLAEIYQRSKLFVSLRDPAQLKGKCGICEFHEVCGGSRARAFALTGDPLAEEPCCVYRPESPAAICGQA